MRTMWRCPRREGIAALVLTLIAINIPVGDGSLIEVEYGVFLGAVLAYLLMRKYRTEHRPIMQYAGDAVKNAITSVCNTSSVVAFGSVVKAAIGFDAIISAMTNIPGPPLLAVAIATTVLAGVCGSGSGGLGIAAPILLELYGGVVPLPALHRDDAGGLVRTGHAAPQWFCSHCTQRRVA